jgi:hypothetical protein
MWIAIYIIAIGIALSALKLFFVTGNAWFLLVILWVIGIIMYIVRKV